MVWVLHRVVWNLVNLKMGVLLNHVHVSWALWFALAILLLVVVDDIVWAVVHIVFVHRFMKILFLI